MKKGMALLTAAILMVLMCACSQGSESELDVLINNKELLKVTYDDLSKDENFEKPDYMDSNTEDFWLFHGKNPVSFNGQEGFLMYSYTSSDEASYTSVSVSFMRGETDAQKIKDWFFSSVEELKKSYTLNEIYIQKIGDADSRKSLNDIEKAKEYDISVYQIMTTWSGGENDFRFATYKVGKDSSQPIEFSIRG